MVSCTIVPVLVIISCISEGLNMSGAVVMVMWCCLVKLLSKCTEAECGAAVLPSNMAVRKNGTLVCTK